MSLSRLFKHEIQQIVITAYHNNFFFVKVSLTNKTPYFKN